MTTQVIGWVAKQAAPYILSYVKDHIFGKAVDQITILENQVHAVSAQLTALNQEVANALSTLQKQDQMDKMWGPITHLQYYTKRMKQCLQSASDGDTADLESFLKDLSNANDGIGYQMSTLYDALLGDAEFADFGGGTVQIWVSNTYQAQVTAGSSFTTAAFEEAVDTKLLAIFTILQNAIVLLCTTTTDPVEAQNMAQEWSQNLTNIQNAAYCAFPPAVKLWQPSYTAPAFTLDPNKWFRLRTFSTDPHSVTGWYICNTGTALACNPPPDPNDFNYQWRFASDPTVGPANIINRQSGYPVTISWQGSPIGMQRWWTESSNNIQGYDFQSVTYTIIPTYNNGTKPNIQFVGPIIADPSELTINFYPIEWTLASLSYSLDIENV
ncbi:uncharacterized protein CTRU02_214016 [Colletotrichum truncatum]|uniref:Uncharacterized protein n=1 Tax=Colletotrichum truncatum TaxID=5467 RepID=A0ACC3YHY1_COLTU|nr:uncharacterized protein CTRU02_06331 [Colletotrichum truncatum]KAF6792835.1 hypothetical protein CTRU02_06331 [Colletotrichum truncatum]